MRMVSDLGGGNSAVAAILKHGFWFVDIPRTGSSSLRAELGSVYGDPYRKGNIMDAGFGGVQGPLDDHITVRGMVGLMGDVAWKKLFRFSLVRNPWDRVYSIYQYRIKLEKNESARISQDMPFADYVRELAEHRRSFQKMEFLRWRVGHRFKLGGWWSYPSGLWDPHFIRSATDYLVDGSGRLGVDVVGKFEDRATFFREINRRLPIPVKGDLRLMATNTEGVPFQAHYDNRTRDIVGRLYVDDIRRFNYSFQG